MVGKIFIESSDVIFGFDHLYLVYQDESGNEFVIRGGPESDFAPFFGNIEVEVGVPIATSEDRRVDEDGNPVTPAQRNQTQINLDGRDARNVWNIALQQARNIDAANLNYNALVSAQNSNSTIASVLNSVGIDINNTLPASLPANTFPGVDNLLAFSTTLNGTSSDDIIFGFTENDTLNGNQGNDKLRGGGDNDTLDGGEDEDISIYQGNFDDYELEFLLDDSIKITDSSSDRDGSDTLRNIEFAQFSDKLIDLRPAQDIAFVIDTTGSMFDDIAAVKARANDIINAIFEAERGLNSRIAVVGYNDPGTNTFLSFTDQPKIEDRKTAARNAINSITVGGGGDFPELVNAGLIRALNGGAGEWREEAAARRIILFGDAPPKDTDLRADVLRLAADVGATTETPGPSPFAAFSIAGDIETTSLTEGLAVTRFEMVTTDADGVSRPVPVEIFTVLIGFDPTTNADFQSLAEATGGEFFTATDASEIVDALIEAIETPVDSTSIVGTSGRDNLTGSDDSEAINGGQGRDVIATGGGNDSLIYSSIVDAGDIVTDFEVGADIFDFSQLLDSFGYEGSDPFADGYIQVTTRGSSSIINVDVDGIEGSGRARQFVLVENITTEDLSNPDNFDF